MVDFTPLVNLRKPDREELVIVNLDVSANLRKIDSLIAFALCTSENRPAPFDGLKILEEDTGNIYIYLSSEGDWVAMGGVGVPGPDAAKGYIAHRDHTTDFINIQTPTEQIIAGLTVTFTAQPGRYYAVEVNFCELNFQLNAGGNPQATGYINLRWAAGGSITTAGTLVNAKPYHLLNINGSEGVFGIFAPNVMAPGNVTVGVGFGVTSQRLNIRHDGGLSITAKDTIHIRDVGPV